MEGKKQTRGMAPCFAAIVAVALSLSVATAARAQTFDNLTFHTITPCRIFDTRPSQGGTGALAAGETRGFDVFGATLSTQGGNSSGCALPEMTSDGVAQTIAIAVNLSTVDPQGGGTLKGWAG